MMNEQKNNSLNHIFESLLKSPLDLIAEIRENKTPGSTTSKLLIISLLGFLIFGVTLGSFSFHEQLWAAPLKTILGITISTLICLPSLYIFTSLTGTTLGLREVAQGLAGALALIACLLLGFTPVLWVFSQSTDSETFFGFLVLIAWLIALFFGTGFLFKMLAQSQTTKTAPLRIWIGIFLLVTLQMSTTLRPLIGRSDHFFTTEKRFFLEHWAVGEGNFNRSSRGYAEKLSPQEEEEEEVSEQETKDRPDKQGATEENPFLNK